MSFATQISNRNFLSPGGFRFPLAKYPKVAYFAQMASIPGMQLSMVQAPTPYRETFIDGTISYSRLNLTFIVDEDLENYIILHNWMRALGVPDKFSERAEFELEANTTSRNRDLGTDFRFADGTLSILDSNFNPKFNVVFQDLKPVDLSTLDFDATLGDQEYFQAQATFDFLSYEIQQLDGTRVAKLK